jgi:hypothetical protein
MRDPVWLNALQVRRGLNACDLAHDGEQLAQPPDKHKVYLRIVELQAEVAAGSRVSWLSCMSS